MSRRVGPVPLTCRLRELLRFAGPAVAVGVWVAAPAPRWRRLCAAGPAGGGGLYVSADLDQLLLLTHHVLAWDGTRLRRLPGAARFAERSAAAP
jgi:hypothetical protein